MMKPPKHTRTHWKRLLSFSLVLVMMCGLSILVAQAALLGWQ